MKIEKNRVRIIITAILGRSFTNPKISKLVEKYDVISFDVFDTLIIREGISTPSDVFNLIHPEDSTFKLRRIEAEKISRLEAETKGLEDIKLCEIYKHLPEYDEKKEIDVELSVCKANPQALAFYNNIKKGKYGKKKIIITSDMYLSRSTIETILANNGYDLDGVNIYVSSEYALTKRSGKLFGEVIRQEQLEGKENSILHIGDNLCSDLINPHCYRMQSCLIKNNSLRPQKRVTNK